MLASQIDVESAPSCIFEKSLYIRGITTCLNVSQDSPVKPSGFGLFFAERYLTRNSISLTDTQLFSLSISS